MCTVIEVKAKGCGRAEEEAIDSVLVISFPFVVGEASFLKYYL